MCFEVLLRAITACVHRMISQMWAQARHRVLQTRTHQGRGLSPTDKVTPGSSSTCDTDM